MDGALESVLIDEAAIAARVREMAREIAADYEGREPLVVGVLKGAVPFVADLLRQLPLRLQLDFIAVSSYGRLTESSGVVRVVKDLDEPVEGRDVILVEDIVDTGLTLAYLRRYLEERGPASLRLCTFLDKPSRRRTHVRLDYVGFVVPDTYVVGYGLDAGGYFRNLPYVASLKPGWRGQA
ncbi:MAG: hypoxanthine phosphoribosyltransferase [Clostridia bacterium]|nr:hypoxanthine phosphoribosyltransferase [Clostridia bacterium]